MATSTSVGARVQEVPLHRYSPESRRASRAAKRSIDLIGAATLLLVAWPVFALCALAILVLEGRPVLFRQTRIGRHGAPFTIVKFRSMVPDAESMLADLHPGNERQGPLFKMHDDPRVTRVGRILRQTCLDELPQLLNVLRGSMSLVGPRPALPSEVACFDDELLDRHRVRPGLTGLWQLRADDMNCFSTYRRLDLAYARGWSIRGDLALLAETVVTVVRRGVEPEVPVAAIDEIRLDLIESPDEERPPRDDCLLLLLTPVGEERARPSTLVVSSTDELEEAPCAS